MDTEIKTHRAFLAERREALRLLYARYRRYGEIMRSKGLISWSNKTHGFFAEFLSDRPYKQRELIGQLLKLQKNITEQSMLLLEMEHALDCEEQKRSKEAA